MAARAAGVEDRRALGDAHRLAVDLELDGAAEGDGDGAHCRLPAARRHCRLADRGLDRARRGLAEAADRRVAHRLRDLGEQRQLVARRCRAAARTASRSSASCWRTVPTRQGTHWPHDSSRKKAAMRSSTGTRSTVSSNTMHDARAERGAGRAGRLERELEVELVGPDEAAGRAAQQHRLQLAAAGDAAGQVEHLAQRDAERRLVEAGPLDAAGEAEAAGCRSTARCRSARTRRRRRARCPSTLIRLSTLLTTVGLPNRPTSTGNGGLLRGSPR